MSGHPYRPIDEEVAAEIKRLHKHHPKLGRHGLLEALRQNGIYVDADELEQFMRANRIGARRGWRPLRWLGAPSWLGGSADIAPANTHMTDGRDNDGN